MSKREVKFRALKDDISNCNFVYGQLIYRIDEMSGRPYPAITKDGILFHSCLQGTESQYTGKKDKDGVDIYDGDIVEFDKEEWGDDNNIHEVFWNEEESAWSWGGGCSSDIDFRKVIGNIYQHPHLLPIK